MEGDFREHPDRVMYSEYPDALVKRGLAKAVIAKAPDSRGTLSTVGTNIYIYNEKYAAVGFSALSFICVVNCR